MGKVIAEAAEAAMRGGLRVARFALLLFGIDHAIARRARSAQIMNPSQASQSLPVLDSAVQQAKLSQPGNRTGDGAKLQRTEEQKLILILLGKSRLF